MALVRANNAVQRVDLPQGCRMHPDFRDGDLLITCPNPRGKNRTGFRVNSNILILSSGYFARQLDDAPAVLVMEEKPTDMAHFLHLLYLGATTTVDVKPFLPKIAHIKALLGMLHRFQTKSTVLSLLQAQVKRRAGDLVKELGRRPSKDKVYDLLKLAQQIKVEEIWNHAHANTDNRAGWALLHDPHNMTREDREKHPNINALLLLAAQVKGLHTSAYSSPRVRFTFADGTYGSNFVSCNYETYFLK